MVRHHKGGYVDHGSASADWIFHCFLQVLVEPWPDILEHVADLWTAFLLAAIKLFLSWEAS